MGPPAPHAHPDAAACDAVLAQHANLPTESEYGAGMRRVQNRRDAHPGLLFVRSGGVRPFIFVAELRSGAARKSRDMFWKILEAAYTCCKSAGQALEIACWLHNF